MEKKKIFIFNYFMYIGGAESALLGLLNAIDYAKYDVDLFLAMHVGEFMTLIPKEVNLLPEDSRYAGYACPLRKVLFSKNFMIGLARLKAKRKYRTYIKNKGVNESASSFQYVVKEMMPYLPEINPRHEYDLAISFIAPHNIVAEKVRARKKICWIHTDYSVVDVNTEFELPVWSAYDYVISISPDVKKTFLQVFPSLSNKIVEMENILSPEFVRKRSEEFNVNLNLNPNEFRALKARRGARASANEDANPNNNNNNNNNFPLTANRSPLNHKHNDNHNDNDNNNSSIINLLSVGRFCEAKNYDNVPDICQRINIMLNENEDENEKFSVRWYIIGFGGDEELIRLRIEEAGMQDHVIILGKRTNPYPYIKACDIYVQPSRYEGKSVTVREAQMLCKPVVVTNYPTAKSQIQDGIDGKIVPMDNEGCAQGLAEFIMNTELQKQIIEYLMTHDYGNMGEVDKLYKLI